MKLIFLLSSLVAATNAADTASAVPSMEAILAAVDANNNPTNLRADHSHHERILDEAFAFDLHDPVAKDPVDEDDQQEEQEEGNAIGQRCGRISGQCRKGLDCADSGVPLVKICLPMTCIETVVNTYNEANANADGTKLYDQYARQVLEGAHNLVPDIPLDGSFGNNSVLFNETVTDMDMDQASSRANFRNVMRTDVRHAFETSLLQTQKQDPLDIKALSAQAQECFQPFMGPTRGNHERGLQGTQTLTLPGFFLELSGLFQFLYAFGVANDDSTDNQDVVVHDICFGGGPTLGAGLGFLLQFWWIPEASEAPENVLTEALLRGNTSGIQNRAPIFLPFPSLMVDIDAALGVGFGAAYSTFAFLCHRLWLKFYIGAGGGLAFSVCFVGVDGGDLFEPGDDDERLL